MGLDPELERILEAVLRSLSTSTRTLRLYPPTSPIPRQTIDAAIQALTEYFASGASRLSLTVARDGFSLDGQPIAATVSGSQDLGNTLRDHGVAQIGILPEVRPEDLLGLLSVVSRPAEDVRAEGGITAVIAALGVRAVQLTDVQLVVADQSVFGNTDARAHLLEIADSPARLGSWFTSVSKDGRDSLRGSLRELHDVAGDLATESLAENLSNTLTDQPEDSRDALLSLALEPGPARELAESMFGSMDAEEIATAILSSAFGRNMLSLSSALINLPFDNAGPDVRREVIAMLPTAGHSPAETEFLSHMIDVRTSFEPEPALAESDRTFRAIVSAGAVSDEDVARAREVTAAATTVLDVVGVRTMFTLLDMQTDPERFFEGADSLVAMVPRLISAGELALVAHLLDELAGYETHHPEWAELPGRLRQTLSGAIGPESAEGIVAATVADLSLVPVAKEILRFSDDATQKAIAQQAIANKAAGIEVGEKLLGMRLIDLLNILAPTAQWFQMAPIADRLAAQADARSIATIGAMLMRPEEQTRKDVIAALAAHATSPAILPLLGSSLRDPSEEIATLAARMIARSGAPGSAVLLGTRLAELDVDNADFALARELIGALARTPEPAADEILENLSKRRALIKRGHFAEIQKLAEQAMAVRRRGGVGV